MLGGTPSPHSNEHNKAKPYCGNPVPTSLWTTRGLFSAMTDSEALSMRFEKSGSAWIIAVLTTEMANQSGNLDLPLLAAAPRPRKGAGRPEAGLRERAAAPKPPTPSSYVLSDVLLYRGGYCGCVRGCSSISATMAVLRAADVPRMSRYE
jgi:hypothetical protein